MTPFIQQAIAERQLGLALHYPFLHSAIVGMNAQRTLEFGAGGSTRVFARAAELVDGAHFSIAMETPDEIRERHKFNSLRWRHCTGPSDSEEKRALLDPFAPFDLILHDGSHAADVVARDIAWAWPLLRPFGLLLVHDTQHSYVGAEVRAGVEEGLRVAQARYSLTTLPYGFGLTIIRKEEPGAGAVSPAPAKATSEHTTALAPFLGQA